MFFSLVQIVSIAKSASLTVKKPKSRSLIIPMHRCVLQGRSDKARSAIRNACAGQLSCAELDEGSIRVQQQASKFTSRPTLVASLSCFCVGSEELGIFGRKARVH